MVNRVPMRWSRADLTASFNRLRRVGWPMSSNEYSTLWEPLILPLGAGTSPGGSHRPPAGLSVPERRRSSRVMCTFGPDPDGWWTSRSVSTSAWTPVPAHLRTARAGHAVCRAATTFPGRASSTEGLRCRVLAGQQLRYRRQDGVRRVLPVVGGARQPAEATGPDRTCSRRGVAHHPAGQVAPGNALGGSHGENLRFPAVVPTRNIAGSHTSQYSISHYSEDRAGSPVFFLYARRPPRMVPVHRPGTAELHR